jgi:hypothetical protein
MLTDDPKDPRLTRGVDTAPVSQAPVYLVLSEAERAKGFVRPLRRSYIHVGVGGSEIDPNDPSKHGRKPPGCGAQTRMGMALCETYARDPKFYGATYCVGCQMHRPVAEFVWEEDGAVVGS